MPFAPRACPNPSCPLAAGAPAPTSFRRRGCFERSDGRRVRRFQCKACGRHCSEQTFEPTWRRRRTDIDEALRSLLARGTSSRAAARLLGVNRKTVQRRARDPRWMRAPGARPRRGPGRAPVPA